MNTANKQASLVIGGLLGILIAISLFVSITKPISSIAKASKEMTKAGMDVNDNMDIIWTKP